MKKCTGGGGGGTERKKKIDRQEQKEEQMRPQPSAYSCFLSLAVQILTLHSNPITLPNWIGCARCSDRIKASIPPTQRWREPCGPQSSILENGPSGSCATINRKREKCADDFVIRDNLPTLRYFICLCTLATNVNEEKVPSNEHSRNRCEFLMTLTFGFSARAAHHVIVF